MSLVYAGILSHAPGITGRAHLAPDKTMRDEFYAYLTKQRRDIESSGAESLIVIAAEHFANFFMDNMPAYCIGIGEKHTGPIEDSEWLKIEKTTIPGAPEFVTACHDAGAFIYYLTGRHVGGMEKGTVNALVAHGFPLFTGKVACQLKPDYYANDREFKTAALDGVRALHGEVVATFENEPGNANLFFEAFPEAKHFLLDTVHSPEAEVPDPALIVVEDFTGFQAD